MKKLLFAIIISFFILLSLLQNVLAVNLDPNPHESNWDSIKVNPITNKIYASSTVSPNLLVIDGSSDTIIHTIPIPNYPTKIVVNPYANKVYALPAWSREIIAIDGSTDNITKTINWTSSGEPPHSININTFTNMVYVTGGAEGLIVINGSSNTIKDVLPNLGSGDLVIDPTRNILYYSDSSSQVYKIINASSNSFINTPFLPFEFTTIIDTKANKTYDETGKVVDLTTNKVFFLPLEYDKNRSAGVPSVAINPKANIIYIKPLNSNTMSVINGTSNTIISTIPISDVYSMDVNPNTNKLYVNSNDKIETIDTVSNKIVNTISISSGNVPEFPFAVPMLVVGLASLMVFYRIKFKS